MNNIPLILASASSARLKLLNQILIKPDKIHPADINENPLKGELPNHLALRLAKEKAQKVSQDFTNAYILAADTVSACGRRILPKALSDDEVRDCLNLLSGRRHKVYTGVAVSKVIEGKIIKISFKIVTSILRFKRLSIDEIKEYIDSKEGLGKSGGCNIDGLAESYLIWMSGSYSNIIGLPLYETKSLLTGLGYIMKE
ncbi:MAG: Maf family nucleotide pyrophosphatase [Alphaproteobacteria bacterium]